MVVIFWWNVFYFNVMKLFKKTEDELSAPLKKGDDKIKIPFIFVCLTQIRNKVKLKSKYLSYVMYWHIWWFDDFGLTFIFIFEGWTRISSTLISSFLENTSIKLPIFSSVAQIFQKFKWFPVISKREKRWPFFTLF